MAWRLLFSSSGETQDTDSEANTITGRGASDVKTITTQKVHGNAGLEFKSNTANSKAQLRSDYTPTTADVGLAITIYGKLSGTPSAEIPIVASDSSTVRDYLRIGTDGRFGAYHTGSVQTLMGRSNGAWSSSGFKETQIFICRMSANAQERPFAIIYFDGVLDSIIDSPLVGHMLDTSIRMGIGQHVGGSGLGCDWYGDSIVVEATTSVDDLPMFTAYPRLKTVGGMMCPPTSEGDSHAWPLGITASPNTFQDVDASEIPDHDSDTSYIKTGTNSDKHLFFYSHDLSGDIDSGATIRWVTRKYALRTESSGKAATDFLDKLGGTEVTTVCYGLSNAYVGGQAPPAGGSAGAPAIARPGGGAWTRADALLSGGKSLLQFGFKTPASGSVGPRVTLAPGPEWIFYTATLPLAPGPWFRDFNVRQWQSKLQRRWL